MDRCMLFVSDGKDPGYSPLITPDGDQREPEISHKDTHTGNSTA